MGLAVIRTSLRAALVVLMCLLVLAEIRDADERNDELARRADLVVQ